MGDNKPEKITVDIMKFILTIQWHFYSKKQPQSRGGVVGLSLFSRLVSLGENVRKFQEFSFIIHGIL